MTKTKLMNVSLEIELCRILEDAEPGSRLYKRTLDKLVLANVGLIHKIVHKFPIKNCSCSYDDLYQEGVAGLIHGIKKFDSTRGYRLSTYCYRWIQAFVSRYFQNNGRTIRVPVHMHTKQLELKKQIETLTRQLNRIPTTEEINQLNERVEMIQESMVQSLSLNQMISENDELECLQGDDNTEDFESIVDCDILLSKVRSEVSERDFLMLTQRYGLCGYHPHTLNEVAEIHGITRARVSQIEHQIMNKLKQIAVR